MSKIEPRKLILQSHLALGDIVMLTAALRDLHRLCPGQFVTDVRTVFPELWTHNPYITPLDPFDHSVETLGCDTMFVAQSGRSPCHYIYCFLDFLNRRLGLQLQPTEFRGDIHLSEGERSAPSPLRELTGKDAPYWIVCAGGKYDLTTKWWATERYQAVVDHFHDRILFIQVGYVGHYHPRLQGVMDLRGRTDLRQLIRLVHQAEGVLCGVTSLMHLAAAVPRPAGRNSLRPCVVVAGGREPPHWEAYPGHQFIHTLGALECCGENGCWKSRTRTLGDGAPDDAPEKRCLSVAGNLPRCMDLITAHDVIRKIETAVDGGTTRYLRKSEARVADKAARRAGPSGFDDLPLTVSSARLALEAYLADAPVPLKHRGRGIVICAGGARLFVNAWVCIKALRRLGCTLPIQVWHLGPEEMDPRMQQLMAPLRVECVDACKMRRKHPVRRLEGFVIKPFALLFSPFRQVLLLDADNLPLRNPESLFESPEFRESGALFWPDFGRSKRADPIWRSCDLEIPAEPEFESGQVLVDKERCWPALRLALWFNEHFDFYYQHLHGDKDTFALAFRRLRTPYHLVHQPPESFPGGMYQHDPQGLRLFQHRTVGKLSLMPNSAQRSGVQLPAECNADLGQLRRSWDGRMAWLRARRTHPGVKVRNRSRAPAMAGWMLTCAEREDTRNVTLANLANTDWGDTPLQILVDSHNARQRNSEHGNRAEQPERVQCIAKQVYHALQQFLETPAEFLLLLEDDLLFNRYLRHNLEHWRPLRQREITLAGLYNPGHRELAFDVPGHAVAVVPECAFGSQALLMSRFCAEHMLSGWMKFNTAADLRLMSLAAQLGGPIYYHSPSLVQHQAVTSTWGGMAHQAADFDPEWKA